MKSGCSSERHQLCNVALSLRRAISRNADSTRCKQWGQLHSLPSVTLGDFVSCAQLEQIAPLCPKPNPVLCQKGNILTHHLILWRVLWSTWLSLSSPTRNLGVVTGKRTSEKRSKPEPQENPTNFQCVLCCIATRSSWIKKKIKHEADLGTSYINSLKMPFRVHVNNEATCFLL